MKFAKELEDDLVPEWRAKYLNYKLGKKKVKAISRALRTVNRTPKTPAHSLTPAQPSSQELRNPKYHVSRKVQQNTAADSTTKKTPNVLTNSPTQSPRQPHPLSERASSPSTSTNHNSQSNNSDHDGERTPLNKPRDNRNLQGGYGSFDEVAPVDGDVGPLPELELPRPAISPSTSRKSNFQNVSTEQDDIPPQSEAQAVDAYHIGHGRSRNRRKPLVKRLFHIDTPGQELADPNQPQGRSSLQRLFTSKATGALVSPDVQLEAYREVEVRQDDFFHFLDKELDKIERFYKLKEDEAHDRLLALRAQLHEHRDQRAKDMAKYAAGRNSVDGTIDIFPTESAAAQSATQSALHNGLIQPLEKMITAKPKIGKTSKAMENLASPSGPGGKDKDPNKSDYTKKKRFESNEQVPHRYAKRRLKLALQEFYRGLELLKSYALLNRTGFRKINKKYDKAVDAHPPLFYLNEKVNEAYFVKSTALDEYLLAVEDLYARYFERGHRKVAVNKLRSKLRLGDHSASAFRNGFFVAAGSGFGIAGLVNGVGYLYSANDTIRIQSSYLMQLYAGYFLALLLFLLFVLDCKIWSISRVNYIFVFEYDTRHVLDWRQLAELPCFFLFLNGLFLWLNFQFEEAHPMYLYWPVMLFGITLLILGLPFRILYYHARKWWAFSNFRLLFAGLYPVEFRDFFLGDMYCSQTYAMSQIEVFFCLYANDWRNPAQCNSNHSMLLGFFTALPAIWRFLQCLRRYYDSRNWFPHLANCAKYMGNILYVMSLSLYRLHVGHPLQNRYLIVFIVFAAINGLYCSLWDVFMDWSLGNLFSKNYFLRNRLAYRKKTVYYLAIVADVILRHQWICYAIFTSDVQHSAAMSFFVALAEVLRRGMWTVFRVENEHCNNVGNFRASRDIPLPYKLPDSADYVTGKDSPAISKKRKQPQPSTAVSTGIDRPRPEYISATSYTSQNDIERQQTSSSDLSLRSRRSSLINTPAMRTLHRVGTVIASAHAQDFIKKKRAGDMVLGDSPSDQAMLQDHSDHSSDDDDNGSWDEFEIEASIQNATNHRNRAAAQRGSGSTTHSNGNDNGSASGGRARSDRLSTPNVEVPRMVEADNEADVTEARRLVHQATL